MGRKYRGELEPGLREATPQEAHALSSVCCGMHPHLQPHLRLAVMLHMQLVAGRLGLKELLWTPDQHAP